MILLAILLIAVGALAAASFIASKQPNAKAAIDKLVPIQGILGIIAALLNQDVKEVVKRFDKDGDGKLDAAELTEALAALRRR